ncbi:hypothetical protein [Tomitella fengzijianii]|uniref:DUF559 domain-containing protein n=1 Tax=Tomitella fengzijianii TaxID=2597660 RepID=A0A516X7Y3_9ACTN|nr:hypothetical protein [Tomitella fengzijianii]QDQ98751.1 hypothetical protein FO059_17195 [Tomitella fengzijianii]
MEGSEPFRAAEAVSSGQVTRNFVRNKCMRILPGVYVRGGVPLTATRRAHAIAMWASSKPSGRCGVVLAGRSAAAFWGAKWIGDDERGACNSRHAVQALDDVDVYRDRLCEDDILTVRGVAITSPARTAFDLARRIPGDEAVIKVDAMYRTRSVHKRQLELYAQSRPRVHGARRASEVIALSAEGADSPQETRMRLAIVRAGFPPPESQIHVRTDDGSFSGYIDLGWRRWRVLLDYEGGGHTERAQLDKDVRRGNALHKDGWNWVRVRAHHLRGDGLVRFLRDVRDALLAAGADPGELPVL